MAMMKIVAPNDARIPPIPINPATRPERINSPVGVVKK
jgi:hypothetical protein